MMMMMMMMVGWLELIGFGLKHDLKVQQEEGPYGSSNEQQPEQQPQ